MLVKPYFGLSRNQKENREENKKADVLEHPLFF